MVGDKPSGSISLRCAPNGPALEAAPKGLAVGAAPKGDAGLAAANAVAGDERVCVSKRVCHTVPGGLVAGCPAAAAVVVGASSCPSSNSALNAPPISPNSCTSLRSRSRSFFTWSALSSKRLAVGGVFDYAWQQARARTNLGRRDHKLPSMSSMCLCASCTGLARVLSSARAYYPHRDCQPVLHVLLARGEACNARQV